eukprot:GHVN01034946.1.p1 GENE.GHVN01034946.1~~GHVN01034946.1.p1  ORF type:complete len:721 (+),score=87.11 GHVN01034946.1:799-2961(+)
MSSINRLRLECALQALFRLESEFSGDRIPSSLTLSPTVSRRVIGDDTLLDKTKLVFLYEGLKVLCWSYESLSQRQILFIMILLGTVSWLQRVSATPGAVQGGAWVPNRQLVEPTLDSRTETVLIEFAGRQWYANLTESNAEDGGLRFRQPEGTQHVGAVGIVARDLLATHFKIKRAREADFTPANARQQPPQQAPDPTAQSLQDAFSIDWSFLEACGGPTPNDVRPVLPERGTASQNVDGLEPQREERIEIQLKDGAVAQRVEKVLVEQRVAPSVSQAMNATEDSEVNSVQSLGDTDDHPAVRNWQISLGIGGQTVEGIEKICFEGFSSSNACETYQNDEQPQLAADEVLRETSLDLWKLVWKIHGGGADCDFSNPEEVLVQATHNRIKLLMGRNGESLNAEDEKDARSLADLISSDPRLAHLGVNQFLLEDKSPTSASQRLYIEAGGSHYQILETMMYAGDSKPLPADLNLLSIAEINFGLATTLQAQLMVSGSKFAARLLRTLDAIMLTHDSQDNTSTCESTRPQIEGLAFGGDLPEGEKSPVSPTSHRPLQSWLLAVQIVYGIISDVKETERRIFGAPTGSSATLSRFKPFFHTFVERCIDVNDRLSAAGLSPMFPVAKTDGKSLGGASEASVFIGGAPLKRNLLHLARYMCRLFSVMINTALFESSCLEDQPTLRMVAIFALHYAPQLQESVQLYQELAARGKGYLDIIDTNTQFP